MRKKHGGNIYKFARENNLALSEIIDFSANINPLGMSKKANMNFDDALVEIMNYPDPDYFELKESISNYEGLSDDNIILGNGAIECIFLLAEHLKAKHAILMAPTFVEYERAFAKYDTELSFMNLSNEANFELDVNKLIKSVTSSVDTILICNPNNPTGNIVSQSDMLVLLDYCKGKNINLIVDEAFIDFLVNEDDYSMKMYIKDYSNLIIIKSLTKFFAVPGLRLGYLLTSNKLISNLINKDRIPWSINSIVANVAIKVLDDHEYIKRTKDYVYKQREYLKTELDKIKGLSVISGGANYIFLMCDHDIKNELEKYNIMIRDCSNYRGLDGKYYRIAVKDQDSNKKLISSLNVILEQEQYNGNN